MPVYNAELYLREAIESILNQTFTDFEFLIINDGSTDSSKDIIVSYQDSRIRYVENESNLKLIATLNRGIDLAKGTYIARMDADDISMPDRLEKQVYFLENHSEYVSCSSWVETFKENEKSNFIKYEENHELIRIKSLYQNHFCHGASLFRKDVVKALNLRFENKFIHAEDYYFFVKLSEKGKLYNIQETLLRVRQHDSNVSILSRNIQYENSINVIKYQLAQLGLHTDDINFDLYFRFFNSNFDLNKEEIDTIERFIIEVIETNIKTNYIQQDVLLDFLAGKWLSLCINSTNTGYWIYNKFNKSMLSKHSQITKLGNLKMIIKSILKI